MRRPRRNDEPGADDGRPAADDGNPAAPGGKPVTFLSAMREAIAGGTAFGTSAAPPPGRAERLGLSPVDQAGSTALAMPFGFLALGDDRRARTELAGVINGLGARVFEFSAGEQVGARGEASGGWSSFRYHVVAAELGFLVPWLAIAVPSTPAPSQRLYPGRRGHDLATGSRKVDRSYRLYTDDLTAARRVIEPAMSGWLAAVLTARIEGRPIVTIEASGGWALAAIPARGMVTPDAVAIRLQHEHPHPGHAGPWPDALLAVLATFRDLVPAACREPAR